jgi:nucleoside-diphosphate-sugar epimerase
VTKVFLAGATGAIGKRLVPQLLDAGCEVFGTTRSERKVVQLKTAGVTPIVSTCSMPRRCPEQWLRFARKSS